jgi:hypothetical protein
LADEIIEIHSFIVQRRKDLAVEFDKEHIRMMRYCCGIEPTPEVKARYALFKQQIEHPVRPQDSLVVNTRGDS